MPPTSVFARANTAVISGAASGVGLAVAHLCRRHGMNIALLDNNAKNLALAKENLSAGSSAAGNGEAEAAKIETFEMDVSSIEHWGHVREGVKKAFGGVDLLMLNAGISAQGGWENTGYFHKTLDVNLFGQIYGLNTFLPVMQSQQTSKPSAIVMTGSKQGITNPPGNPAYNASKAAINSLASHLSYDMRGSNTSVHLLVPGWTFTGLSGGGPSPTKEKPAGAWTPEQVASYLEEKMGEGKFWIICPDNDVTEDKDRRRMLWTAGDAVYGRPPLSRWREEWKGQAEEWMANVHLEGNE